jgi:mono/diheme cytochrome c family protein
VAEHEESAYARAKPVFDRYCASCHASKGERASEKKLGHFNMDGYPFTGHHAAEIGQTIRKVLGVSGGEPTMPKDQPGVVAGDELERVVAWSKAFDDAHSGGNDQEKVRDAGAHTHHH